MLFLGSQWSFLFEKVKTIENLNASWYIPGIGKRMKIWSKIQNLEILQF